MEDIEDTQYFDEENVPDVAPLDAGENHPNDEGK